MKLAILTWNINFIHDNWLKRLDNINKTLQIEIENSDIIAFIRLHYLLIMLLLMFINF